MSPATAWRRIDYPMPCFEEERSPMSARPKSAIALRWGQVGRSNAGKSVWWANVLKVERQPAMHPIAVRA
jgi:hypothetical protein